MARYTFSTPSQAIGTASSGITALPQGRLDNTVQVLEPAIVYQRPVTTSFDQSSLKYAFSGDTYTLTIENCTSVEITSSAVKSFDAVTVYFARWEAYQDGNLFDSSGLVHVTAGVTKTYTFAYPVTFTWVRTSQPDFTGYFPDPVYAHFSRLKYTQTTFETILQPWTPTAVSLDDSLLYSLTETANASGVYLNKAKTYSFKSGVSSLAEPSANALSPIFPANRRKPRKIVGYKSSALSIGSLR